MVVAVGRFDRNILQMHASTNIIHLSGYLAVDIIEKCSCTAPCYRASLLEYIYDYSYTNEKDDNNNEKPGFATIASEPVIKVILLLFYLCLSNIGFISISTLII